MAGEDPFDLRRFVEAQDPLYGTVIAELRNGAKRSHWMWFVFPQLRGLGRTSTAMRYGIASADEAKAYLAHEVLGARLRECARLVEAIEGRSADDVFGWPDTLKLRSSMTLFARVADDPDARTDFVRVLDKFYDGIEDDATVELLTAR